MKESVIVTGASTGLGLETAVHLAERGFKVYATMRDLAKREALRAETTRRKVDVEVLRLDVNDRATIDEAVNSVVETSEGIYGLINFAGTELVGYFEDLTDEEIRQQFETNVFGTMAVIRAVLPHMRAAGKGRILVITSVAGKIGALGLSAYCASRFAQEGFAESLYQEVRPLGINVSIIEPGIVNTEHWTSGNHVVAQGARSASSPYRDWFQKLEKLTEGFVEAAPTKPSHVAEAAYNALTAKRPKLRYLVSRRASILLSVRRYVPTTLFERLYFGAIIRRVTQAHGQ